MELQTLNIDNYVNWYKELSRKVEFATDNEWRINRYALTGWGLFMRSIHNEANVKSKELSERLMDESKQLSLKVEAVKKYMPDKEFSEIWFVPPVREWIHFDRVIDDFANTPIEFITDKLKSAALPPIKILTEELERINQTEWNGAESVLNGHPFLKSAVEKEGEGWGIKFALFVSDCYFAKWLASRIKELENPAPENAIRLPWKGTAKDLSELIKALSLTALKGVQETEIIRLLGSVFDINGKPFNGERHRININELQDKKPKDMFTAQLHKAINNFLMNTTEIDE